jgi:uncharacterized protein (DUF1684 family)
MFRNKFFLLIVIVAAALIGYSLFSSQSGTSGVQQPADARAALLAERQEKDQNFKEGSDSPIADKAAFTGLRYFEPAEGYRVEATLERMQRGATFTVQMTQGKAETYRPFAVATFTLDGEKCRLLLFESAEDGLLFVPFRDKTSGEETYGGGRYLDVPEEAVRGNTITLDFNRAYHPFCVYNPDYTCPIPPAENTLPVAVRAGERL